MWCSGPILDRTTMVPMPGNKKTAVPPAVNDFIVLPLQYPATPSYTQTATHHLYLRANAPKVPTDDTPREVFLVNVPIDATETHIRSLFADQLGGARIERVDFEGARVGKGITAPVAPSRGKKRKRSQIENGEDAGKEVGLLPDVWDRELHRSGGTAVVTFVDKASADLALREARRAIREKRNIIWGAGIEGKLPPLGSARYLAHHKLSYPDHATLQNSVDEFMTAFAAQEAAKAKALARQHSVPDADGFITVTRGARVGLARDEDVKMKEEDLRKREKSKVNEDFYRFQNRERRKAEAGKLVKGFEEDRRRVEEMRRRRGKIRPD
ncbi:hypothetical protein BAUCODRAFT_398881 [Baudoinia panamericana UAMH 10762]|uniref:RRM domain-containing protein n=1 Tax=Baudoinia panamericana (strain UAMH 10762) TaxID=717646 RepID=M2LX87_BAUPA|nr:uncharacterized protein BAUCODRAFT_398881 [Baudoinia panamericana UAMH 10762]EMC99307.1 hypothetical protein BAUCODRAFT_398881 [Baudoinia panamericana UAMH 10762]